MKNNNNLTVAGITGVFFTVAVSGASAASAHFIYDSSDMTATTLLVFGLLLLMLEVKIVSQGILGFIGSVLLITSAVLLWRDGTPFWGVPVGYIIPAIAMVVMLAAILTWLAIKAQQEKVVMGYQGFVGEVAEVVETIDPEGRVMFQGTYWQAVSRVPLIKGDKVRVVAADRLKLVVEPLTLTVDPAETIKEPDINPA